MNETRIAFTFTFKRRREKTNARSIERAERTNRKTIQFAAMQSESQRNIARVILENCDGSNFALANFAL